MCSYYIGVSWTITIKQVSVERQKLIVFEPEGNFNFLLFEIKIL